MIRGLWLTLFIILFYPPYVSADKCIGIKEICIEGPSTKVVNGEAVTKPCWNYESTFSCIKENDYKDYCAGIRSTNGCTQTGSACLRRDHDNSCGIEQFNFRCGNLLSNTSGATFINTEHTIVKDQFNTTECDRNSNQSCRQISNVCVEGPETRIINGYAVTRDCWRYKKEYACKTGVILSDCEELLKNCQFIKEDCLSKDAATGCSHKQKTYRCPFEDGKTTEYMFCGSQMYCIDGDCYKSEYQENKNMPTALAHLEMLKNLKDHIVFDAKMLSIFQGNKHECHKTVTGFNNCCKDHGWGNDLKLARCTAEEKNLADLQNNGVCSYVGKDCAEELAFGVCKVNLHSYCCYESKFSRVIQEQARMQLGIDFGTPKDPQCQGLTIDQFKQIKWDQIDMSEIKADFQKILVNFSKELEVKNADAKAKAAASQAKDKFKDTKFNYDGLNADASKNSFSDDVDENIKITDHLTGRMKDYYDR
jgi:conjugal transfer mating pair stabilization protein TraN